MLFKKKECLLIRCNLIFELEYGSMLFIEKVINFSSNIF